MRTLLTAAAVAAAIAAPAVPASATPTNGCTATSGQACTFVATGDVRYVAAGLGGCEIKVIRNFSTVYTFTGNLPPTDVITEADAGDTIRVSAAFAFNPTAHTVCDVRDAQ